MKHSTLGKIIHRIEIPSQHTRVHLFQVTVSTALRDIVNNLTILMLKDLTFFAC